MGIDAVRERLVSALQDHRIDADEVKAIEREITVDISSDVVAEVRRVIKAAENTSTLAGLLPPGAPPTNRALSAAEKLTVDVLLDVIAKDGIINNLERADLAAIGKRAQTWGPNDPDEALCKHVLRVLRLPRADGTCPIPADTVLVNGERHGQVVELDSSGLAGKWSIKVSQYEHGVELSSARYFPDGRVSRDANGLHVVDLFDGSRVVYHLDSDERVYSTNARGSYTTTPTGEFAKVYFQAFWPNGQLRATGRGSNAEGDGFAAPQTLGPTVRLGTWTFYGQDGRVTETKTYDDKGFEKPKAT